MEFTLHYRGRLSSNGRPAEKHAIRQHFHAQLRDLWSHLPLKMFESLIGPNRNGAGLWLRRPLHGFEFVPLVAEEIALVAELNILMLWPSAPGAIITSGGDIDNRIKTLLDALKLPSEATALPPGSAPGADETPFFCLLEDDSLVTKLSVETDRLLEPVSHPSEVVLVIRIRTRQLKVMFGTIGLA